MPEDVVPLLHRRSDLSTFLVHLTRATAGHTAFENLTSILLSRNIEARSVHGMAKAWARHAAAVEPTQRCVCFTEAPLEQAWMITKDIAGRGVPLSPYGVVFTKAFGRRRGVNPVWYIDITPNHNWLTNPINTLVEIARRGASYRIDSTPPDVSGSLVQGPPPDQDPILKVTPFFEQMGPTGNAQKEFWWEREWRHVGDFGGWTWNRIVAVFAPAGDHNDVVTELAAGLGHDTEWVERRLRFLDPAWGLERMIAGLAGIDEEDAGPLPQY